MVDDLHNPKKIFDPRNVEELIQGWLIHAHKGRDRHDKAARRCARNRLWLGGAASILSAIVGTSIFASFGEKFTSKYVQAVVILLGILSAILTGLSTFLNLSEQAEKHRSAGVQYKKVIRDLAFIRSQQSKSLPDTNDLLTGIKKTLDDLEESAPVMPERIFDKIDNEYKNNGIMFAPTADELYLPKS
jgi:hypothetical protein